MRVVVQVMCFGCFFMAIFARETCNSIRCDVTFVWEDSVLAVIKNLLMVIKKKSGCLRPLREYTSMRSVCLIHACLHATTCSTCTGDRVYEVHPEQLQRLY